MHYTPAMALDELPPERPPAGPGAGTRVLTAVHDATARFAVPAAGGERPHILPLVQSAAFDYPDAASADLAARGQGYLYSRVGNPTVEAFARVIAELEGGAGALAFASGMAAISAALLSRVRAGDRILAADGLYGTSHELLTSFLPRYGVEADFVDACDPAAVERALRPTTRVIYVETITNPLVRVPDLPRLAAIARAHDAALIVDNTFATPLLSQPLKHGATLSLHSASKYLSGHGDLIGGVVVGSDADMARVGEVLKIVGGMMDPFCAWLALRGVRTLALRVERQVASAQLIAATLAETPGITRVAYPGLRAHPDHEVAQRVLRAPGAMLAFDVGSLAAARRMYDRARLVRRAASLGEIDSLFTHPVSFSHRGVPAAERERAGITEGLLRLSVGIEDPTDLIDDLLQALNAAPGL